MTTVHDMDDEKFRTRHDPQERDLQLRAIIKAAEQEAEEAIRRDGFKPPFMGYCHLLWGYQKNILKKKYGIDWKTPAEMNSDILFD